MADNVSTTLRKALTRLNSEKAQVGRQIGAMETALAALAGRGRATGGRRVRRRMSVAARREVGARMKAYWAKRRKTAAKRP